MFNPPNLKLTRDQILHELNRMVEGEGSKYSSQQLLLLAFEMILSLHHRVTELEHTQ